MFTCLNLLDTGSHHRSKSTKKMMLLDHKSRYFPIFLISLVAITSFSNSQQPTYNDHLCSYPSDDEASYRTNLNPLLSSLSSKATFNTFYKDTLNGIYSLFLCRGDVSSSTCQTCVDYAAQKIIESCQANRSAIIWYDQCMLRYSDINFFGSIQTVPNVVLWNVQNNTSPDETDVGALALIFSIAEYAPYTDMMYGTNESVAADGTQHRYGMGQCSRDMSSNQCRSCLARLTDGLKECCQGKKGWRILTPSCSLRYEESIFYNEPLLTPTVLVPDGEGKGGGGHNKTLIIVVITVSSITVLAALLGILYCSFHRNRKQRVVGKNKEGQTYADAMEGSKYNRYQDIQGDNRETHFFKLSTLEAATNSFSDENKLGEGGFGAVYKGMLLDGKEIAVKRLSMKSKQGVEEFKNEVTVIAKLQHKNLVRLLGCCLEGDEKLLVYEYLANNSLDAFLFDPIKCKELDWEKRTNIVNGIARGLLYLHEDSRLKIIHRDMKASNVLLDDEMNPKISDFGTARIFGGKQIEDTTVRVVGTYGYMAPEYALEGAFSIKSDVYSFGILLLEVASGKKNRGSYHPECAPSLVAYAWKLWNEGKLEELLDDEKLGEECPATEGLRWIHIALLCVQENPAERPAMSTVVLMLGSSSVSLPMPLQSTPLFSANRYIFCDETASTNTNEPGIASDQCSTTAST